MSVLVECYNFIVRKADIEERFRGGLDAYASFFPETFCMDEHLTRVGFMAPSDLSGFAKHFLSVAGLGGAFEGDKFWVEPGVVAVVEQLSGVWQVGGEPWLDYAEGDQKVCWCWLKGTGPGELATPPGWYPDPTMVKLSRPGPTGTLWDVDDPEDSAPYAKDTVTLYHSRVFPESENN